MPNRSLWALQGKKFISIIDADLQWSHETAHTGKKRLRLAVQLPEFVCEVPTHDACDKDLILRA